MPAAKAAWVRLPLRELKPNPDNPRVIKDDKFRKLVQSIREFPQMLELRPIVVNGDRVVLGGNMRLKACKEAGLKDVPVVIADDLTPAQQREFVVKDNASFGEWDWEALANEWETTELAAWGVDMPAFDAEEIEMPALPNADHSGLQQMAFIVTNDQADVIREALELALAAGAFVDTGNENRNGNALARIAEAASNVLR